MKTSFALFFFFCVGFFIVGVHSDVCTFEKNRLYSRNDIVKCWRTIPFNETIAKRTLTNLAKAMELYAFLDIAGAPPDPEHFNPPVPLLEEFVRIESTSFQYDWEFHNAIRNVFIQLHDAHTMYYAPESYASFAFYQPLNFVAFLEEGRHVVSVSTYFDEGVAQYWKNQGVDLESLIGAEVLEIDGQPALEFLRSFAYKRVGSSKDPGTRFNIALNIPGPYASLFYPEGQGMWLGLYSARTSHFLPPPEVDFAEYTLRKTNGEVVTHRFNWLGRSSAAYNDQEAFHAAWESKWTNAKGEEQQTSPKRVSSVRKPNHKVVDLSRNAHQERTFAGETPHEIIPIVNSTAGGAGAWQVGKDTLVWHMNTFAPANYFDFQTVGMEGILYAQQHGLSNLIIDMTLNGGGDICLGRQTLAWVAPNHTNYGPTDMPSSECARNLTETATRFKIQNTEWSSSFYQNQDNVQFPANSTEWLIPGVPHVRGGLLRNYSQEIHISSVSQDCGNIDFVNNKPFKPETNIIILSSGFCGSTCALFSNHLANYEHVRTVAVGGFVGEEQQYTSFPGLEVLETPGFYSIMRELKQEPGDIDCEHCTSPREMPTSAGFRFCCRQIYGPKGSFSEPLEYTWQPATLRHYWTKETVENPRLLWIEIAQRYFSQ